MNELQGKNIDIEPLGDASLLDLKNRLQETEDNYQCIDYIECYLLNKLRDFASDKFDRMNAVVLFLILYQHNHRIGFFV